MATIDIVYICGCGFKTKEIGGAEAHADQTKHTVTSFSGSIKPSVAIHTRPAPHVAVDTEAVKRGHEEFAALKARLARKA